MKILFAGLGSVGQRHLQNIQRLQQKKIINDDLQILALIEPIDVHRVIREGKLLEVNNIADYYLIKTTTSLAEAKEMKPDVVFVVNPSSLHTKTALEFAKKGSDVFIEKPLDASLDHLDELQDIIRDKHLVFQVGYQTRFNPLVHEIKQIIQDRYDTIIAASFEWNNIFLPFHHRYEDYTKGYAARSDLGGGAVLGLIHDIDLMYYLLGMPQRVMAVGGKLSDLEMTTEDLMMALFEYDINAKTIPVYLNLSYVQAKEVRLCKVQFTDSTLFVDLIGNAYELCDMEGKVIGAKKYAIVRNDLFIAEVDHFLKCVQERKEPSVTLAEGRKSLEIALKIKKSMKTKQWESIKDG